MKKEKDLYFNNSYGYAVILELSNVLKFKNVYISYIILFIGNIINIFLFAGSNSYFLNKIISPNLFIILVIFATAFFVPVFRIFITSNNMIKQIKQNEKSLMNMWNVIERKVYNSSHNIEFGLLFIFIFCSFTLQLQKYNLFVNIILNIIYGILYKLLLSKLLPSKLNILKNVFINIFQNKYCNNDSENIANCKIIVARNARNYIGKDGKLLYKLPLDMKFFKDMTINKYVIMGRVTYESLNYKPLKNRINIIVSSSETLPNIDNKSTYLVRSITEAVSLAYALSIINKKLIYSTSNEIYFIGGERIYNEGFKFANTVYVTLIDDDTDGDVKFIFPKDEFVMSYNSKIIIDNNLRTYRQTFIRKSGGIDE